ncbi:hypothetical protein G6011_03454 [Alternaria panax]|uniref:Uncharacterized protein n=1 Tax=Alternaria panax TaxID=48097 RepID=A0AAD4NT68_9PLEO|nr:hypothetical protein G6011_03454 [Alternaria panax]
MSASEGDTKVNESMDVESSGSSPRRTVARAYQQLLTDQVSQPDRIFIGGDELKHLDPNFVALDEDTQEYIRVILANRQESPRNPYCGRLLFPPTVCKHHVRTIHPVMGDMGIKDSTVGDLHASIFIFALTLGLLFIAPLGEKYSAAAIIHIGNFFFGAFSLGGGCSQIAAQFSVCSLFAGFGESAAVAVVGGLVFDVGDLAARQKASGLHRPTGHAALVNAFVRPLAYLVLDQALLLASKFYSVVFGVRYGHSVGIVAAGFLAAGIGMLLGTFATIRTMEAIFRRDSSAAFLVEPYW